ncbi:PREDICTED: G kinase-anchoring protein 1-A-like [Ceratosolen solmsi marchali]|uniref:G kinase-anchoring protein 1-A-like n=1 Tax=Ceratosolen solmsi marchali TaxID=326594 RepID=A0AAJ6YR69_9HYME|nr:PREDICTED: G kinase-anchoring protein 1-A-like [Ceratosolen solmsi marchali]
MVTTVPSRFAVLTIDDDDYIKRKSHKSVNTKNNTEVKDEKQTRLHKKNYRRKKNKEKEKKSNINVQEWEQWKRKDSMVIEKTYEQELNEAILLSKLSYEETQMEMKHNVENNGNNVKKSNKKSKKSMSLEEFNNFNEYVAENKELKIKKEENSLKEIEKEASKVLTKEKENSALKIRLHQLDDGITSAQLKTEIEKRDSIIEKLKIEINQLKEDVNNVKNRNRRLYQILQQGEMKDKATILAEVIKLHEIRDELTTEVTLLHAQLEQERSKTRASFTDIKTTKQNGKKRLGNDNI